MYKLFYNKIPQVNMSELCMLKPEHDTDHKYTFCAYPMMHIDWQWISRIFDSIHSIFATKSWLFHTRKCSVWVNRRQQSDVACDVHTLPISRRWGETLEFLHFLLKQTTALIEIFRIKLSFIELQCYDIKMLDLR